MKMLKGLLAAGMSIVACATATSASAAVTVYTDQAAFLTASGASQLTFDFNASTDYTTAGYTNAGVSFSIARGVLYGMQDGMFDKAKYLATTSSSLNIASNGNSVGLVLGSAESRQTVSYNANGVTGTVAMPSPSSGSASLRFLGFVADTPLTISLSNNAELDVVRAYATAAAVTTPVTPSPAAAAVPEPATWAMMIAGFGVIGGSLRRRASPRRQAVA